MQPFVVPQLLEKLKLLCRYGRFENLADIAAEFGISEDAVRFWTKDTGRQTAGTVPQQRVDGLLALYAEHLPNHGKEEIETLLKGPLADLEDALRTKAFRSLSAMIKDRVDTTSGKLIPVNTAAMGLVVANRLSRTAHCSFPLGKSFRLEFETAHRGRYLLGLQNSPQAWGCVEAEWSEDSKVIRMPGRTATGEWGSLVESADDGVSRFYALQSLRQFPSAFAKALTEEVPLTRTELSLLAQFLEETPNADVHIMRFDVEFIDPLRSSR